METDIWYNKIELIMYLYNNIKLRKLFWNMQPQEETVSMTRLTLKKISYIS